MNQMIVIFGIIILYLPSAANPKQADSHQPTIEFHFDEQVLKSASDETSAFFGVERIFKNPAVVSGLANSADSINRSIESLMDALFYSILDNEIYFDLTKDSQFGWQLKRDLFSTNRDSYVIVERFKTGPRMYANLTAINQVPLDFSANSSINVLHIYLRNDGIRLTENESAPWWRKTINNWFGLLPLLTRILPPSFNRNELYDPIKLVSTPFIFPFSITTFKNMPVGTIRSYSLDTDVRIPIDLLKKALISPEAHALGLDDSESVFPFSVFKTGEHRINILKKKDNIAWIGLSNTQKLGHSLNFLSGQSYAIFAKLSPLWSGIPAPIFPINIEFENADIHKNDLLFEFDLSNPKAMTSYLDATRGDFTTAYEKYRNHIDLGVNNGVQFHFRRITKGIEKKNISNQGLYILRNSLDRRHFESEIEIEDENGIFYILESILESSSKNWDVLVGSEEKIISGKASIRVVKKDNNHVKTDQKYKFMIDGHEHTDLVFSLNIDDRYVDTHEFNRAIKLIEDIFSINLNISPLPIYIQEHQKLREAKLIFEDPTNDIVHLTVPPTHLGRFSASASVRFDQSTLTKIAQLPKREIAEKLLHSYGLMKDHWLYPNDLLEPSALIKSPSWLVYPLKLFNINFEETEAVGEVQEILSALEQLRKAPFPLKMLHSFSYLMDTSYPEKLIKGLINLADPQAKLQRNVHLFTKPKGPESPARTAFQKLNGFAFRAHSSPKKKRYRITRDKLLAFIPNELKQSGTKPSITKIQISNQRAPGQTNKHLFIKIKTKGLALNTPAKIFVKLEQEGELNVGRFLLTEKVFSIERSQIDTYQFYLTGPNSPLNDDFLLPNILNLFSSLRLTLGISSDGLLWSSYQTASFKLDVGKLLPYNQENP